MAPPSANVTIDGGGVDVAVLRRSGGSPRTVLGRVHLDGALTGDPVRDVEVVYGAVAEDAARGLAMYSIGGGRGLVVVLRTVCSEPSAPRRRPARLAAANAASNWRW